MQISHGTALAVFWLISVALFVAMMVTHAFIIREICRKNGWKYHLFWFFWASNDLRIGMFSWLDAARKTGYFKVEAALVVIWILVLIGFMFVSQTSLLAK